MTPAARSCLAVAIVVSGIAVAAPLGRQSQGAPPQTIAPPDRPTTVIPPPGPVITGTIRQPGQTSRTSGKRPVAPAPLSRPSARFSLLFLQYRHGDSDAAVDTLSKWTEGDVIAEAVPSPNDDVWMRASLASFLTEAGMHGGRFGYFSEFAPQSILLRGWGLDKVFEIYSYRSYSIVKDLTRIADRKEDDRLRSFCARWYVYMTSFSIRYRRPALTGLQAMADHDLSEDPDVSLMLGSIYESRSGPFAESATAGCGRMIVSPDGCVPNPKTVTGDGSAAPTQEAAFLFKHALKVNPNLAEAHLRLGRLQHLLNQTADARPHLEQALQLAAQQDLGYVAYMAELYLGDIEEHDEHWPRAIALLRAAVRADPGAHIANIALGEALLRSGDRSGWVEAKQMFEGESQDAPRSLDPWFFYRFAQYWHMGAWLREIRQIARSTP